MATMFEKAAEHVAKVSGEKTLHPVVDLNTAERFKPLCIVERRKSFWFWKKPVMSPTLVTMNELLSKGVNLSSSKKSFTLLKNFQEEPTFEVSGSIGAKILSEANIELKANEKLHLALKLGDIEKNEIPWGTLSDSLRSNPVKHDHPLYLRAKQNPDISFCVVIGSVCTKGDSVLEEDEARSVSTDDQVNLRKLTVIDVQVHIKASVEKKTAYSFTIPPNTVLAYSSVEFSISPVDSMITLHSTFDTFDDAETPAFDVTDGAGRNDPVVTIKREMTSLISSKEFEELRAKFRQLLHTASNTTLLVMRSLLQSAVKYLENKNSDNFILLSTFADFIDDDAMDSSWKEILTLLGFSLPQDSTHGSAFVVLPGTGDGALLKTCIELLDSLMNLSRTARKHLNDVTVEQKKLILKSIEKQLRKESISLDDLSDRSIKENSSSLDFLKECGFEVAGDGNTIEYSGYTTDSLLDVYIVIYTLL